MPGSLLGIGDVHSVCRRDLERLESCHRHAGLHVVFELDKGDARARVDHPDLLEPGELLEQHAEHLAVGRRRQVLDEQDFVGGLCPARPL